MDENQLKKEIELGHLKHKVNTLSEECLGLYRKINKLQEELDFFKDEMNEVGNIMARTLNELNPNREYYYGYCHICDEFGGTPISSKLEGMISMLKDDSIKNTNTNG